MIRFDVPSMRKEYDKGCPPTQKPTQRFQFPIPNLSKSNHSFTLLSIKHQVFIIFNWFLFRMIAPEIWSRSFATLPIRSDSFEHFRHFRKFDCCFFLHERLSLFIQSLINVDRLEKIIGSVMFKWNSPVM